MKVVDEFDVSPDGTHMGIITFTQNANLLFDFTASTYHNPQAIKNEVSKVTKLYPNTRTDKALMLANSSLFTASGGDRPDKPNLLFVFTDGKPYPTTKKSGYEPFDMTIPPLEVCCRINRLKGIIIRTFQFENSSLPLYLKSFCTRWFFEPLEVFCCVRSIIRTFILFILLASP